MRLLYPSLILLTLCFSSLSAQVTVSAGATLYVAPGSIITVNGSDIYADPFSTIDNRGLIATDQDVSLAGELIAVISGPAPVTGYGQLTAGGTAYLYGTLSASLAADYTPLGEVSLPLVDAGTRTGEFSTVNYPAGSWHMNYTATEARLESGAALPVTWLSFTARAAGETVVLDWATANEENSDYYGVERETADGNWEEIGRVAAAGFTTTETAYTFTDSDPLSGGDNYYRLRQVDLDGALEYSTIVTVRLSAATELALFPNPASRVLYLTGPLTDRSYVITDGAGRRVLSGRLSEDGLPRIDLPASLSGGLYFLHFGRSEVKRFAVIR